MRQSHIAVIGVPLDLGAGRRGVDMGPSALRVAGPARAAGRPSATRSKIWATCPCTSPRACPRARRARATCPKSPTPAAAWLGPWRRPPRRAKLPLVLGGDHSVAVGSVSGMSRASAEAEAVAGPHLDRRPRRHEHPARPVPAATCTACRWPACIGQGPRALTHIYGYAPKVDPAHVALVGVREVDQLEKPHVRNSGVRAFTMRDIDERGLRAVMEEAIQIASAGTGGFHVSFDMDAVDPREAPGVGTPVRGGITYREAHLAMEIICDSRNMTSMDVVEVNPVIDEANRTAVLAVELVMSAMGKRIL